MIDHKIFSYTRRQSHETHPSGRPRGSENGGVEETTKGGIILTASAKEKPSIAEVISVGPGGMVDGKEVIMTVKVGDKVITSQYAGSKVTLENVEYIVVRQNDILAIVE